MLGPHFEAVPDVSRSGSRFAALVCPECQSFGWMPQFLIPPPNFMTPPGCPECEDGQLEAQLNLTQKGLFRLELAFRMRFMFGLGPGDEL